MWTPNYAQEEEEGEYRVISRLDEDRRRRSILLPAPWDGALRGTPSAAKPRISWSSLKSNFEFEAADEKLDHESLELQDQEAYHAISMHIDKQGPQPGYKDNGVPFTDSGYASGPHQRHLPDPQPTFDINRGLAWQGKMDQDETRTLYSAATTISPVHSRAYISEVSHDIFTALHQELDHVHWPTLFRSVPELIKSFAIDIGRENTSQVNRDIMYFIHKRHG